MDAGQRLLIYDRTCRGRRGLPGLTHAWWAGGKLYRALGRLDGVLPAGSWAQALDWLAARGERGPIRELQFWGHGKWGEARIGGDVLDAGALGPGHPLNARLLAVRARLIGEEALWWFRTCETFGARPGQAFAGAFADLLGCRVAGHTFIIGPFQSGLHALRPGERPGWPEDEGLLEGTPARHVRARWSGPRAPNTVTMLAGQVPEGW